MTVKKLLVIATIFLLLSPAWGQEELLPFGAYGTTIQGGIGAGESKAYQMTAIEGQVFKANLQTRGIDKGATLELLDSEGESMLGGLEKLTKIDTMDLILPKDDTYMLNIKGGDSSCSYVLEVTLEDPPAPKKGRTRGTPSEPIENPEPIIEETPIELEPEAEPTPPEPLKLLREAFRFYRIGSH